MSELEKKIKARVQDRLQTVRKRLRTGTDTPVRRPPFGIVSVGETRDGAFFTLPHRDRSMHMHVIGATGKGKTNTLEHMIRQDILHGRGVCVIDPHGGHKDSLYNNLLRWLAATGVARHRRIHLIDPADERYVTGFNPVRLPEGVDVSVVADATLEAFERAWGDEETRRTPRIRRVLTAVFSLLAERGLTLADAPLLLDPDDADGFREHLIDILDDCYTRDVWDDLHTMSQRSARDFREYIEGPLNRLAEFTRSRAIRAMVGQTERVLDFKQIMDDSHIVLANLQGGDVVSPKAAQLLGTLIVRDLFENCKRRAAPDRPFYLYVDECHQYLSGDIPAILDQARKFGLHAVLSHQRLGQLREAGADILNAITSCTYIKLIMGGLSLAEAGIMADENIPLDIERPVEALTRPTVVGHKRTELASRSQATNWSETRTVTTGETTSEAVSISETHGTGASSGTSTGTAARFDDAAFGDGQVGLSTHSDGAFSAESQTESFGQSETHGRACTESVSHGTTSGTTQTRGTAETLEPVLEDRPTGVHSLETMRYVAARALRDLETGQACIAMGKRSAIIKVPYAAPPMEEIELREYKDMLFKRCGTATTWVDVISRTREGCENMKTTQQKRRVEEGARYDGWGE